MRFYRLGLGAATAVVALGIAVVPANAAVTIGETFAPNAGCTPPITIIGSGAPPAGPSYAAPSAGVITSWSYQTGVTAPTVMRLKVARGIPTSLTTVARGALEVPTASTVNSFPTRLSVQAGDFIGVFMQGANGTQCASIAAGFTISLAGSDPAPGSTDAYAINPGGRSPVSAQLEPDVDNDGFGDETQDLCPTDADTVKACRDKTDPETSITKKPKKKDKKKKAKFEFNSSEAGATFRCSLNGSAFDVCTSPRSVKAKKGLNTFTVFARDAAGNIDETPATHSWTYKKPKKK